MKNPNGYGCVFKLSGNRRKPFGVRVTIGWDENRKQLYRYLGYYETRAEAMIALAEFNKNPYSMDAATITFAEVFEKWSAHKFTQIAESSATSYRNAYNYCESLYNMRFVDIRLNHLQGIINESDRAYPTRKVIKTLMNQLFVFAMANDIVSKNYAEFVDIGKKDTTPKRKPFSKKEIKKLFDNVHRMEFIDTVLIMIFTGVRVGELLEIRNETVDIENRIMRGGSKTEAGKDRVIPINKKILPFVKAWHERGHEFLIVNHEDKQMSYWNYYEEKWKKIMEQLEMDHRPHDCRHTFASLMDSAGANKLCIKRIMGHASKDITDKVYTHKDIEELKEAVDLI